IIAVGRPLAVAMAAQVRRQDMPVLAQRIGNPVPVAAVVAPTMDEEQRRPCRIAPIDIMQAKPLREIDPRSRAGAVEVQSKDPRALGGVRRGSLLRSCASRSALWAELCLGLSTWLPMPSGRQLLLSRWRHVCGTPSRLVVDSCHLRPAFAPVKSRIAEALGG